MPNRKDFMGAAAMFASAPLIGAASPSPQPPPEHPVPMYDFDETQFNAILAKPALHRQCFGATKLAGGSVLDGMFNSMRAYEQYLHEASGSMHAVAVLYHGTSIGLAMNDAIWDKYLTPFIKNGPQSIRDEFKDETLGKGNPYLHADKSDPDDNSVETLVGRGSSFFVCHNALAGFTGALSHALKKPYDTVYNALMNGVVPGALVVPAGVMAVNACQEAHFTYISAS